MGSLAVNTMNTIRKAREDFLASGISPAGLVSDTIIRSWQRSAERGIGMERGETRCTPRHELMRRRELNSALLLRSQPIMENLYHEICGTSSIVLLADKEGVILHSIGDPDFVDQAQKVYLKPGGIWSEGVNGTNAIGTALEEQAAVHVHSSEHFIDKNRFLSCSATPIFDPWGAVLGALDVSGDYRAHQKHTMALVRFSAQIIENQMFAPESPTTSWSVFTSSRNSSEHCMRELPFSPPRAILLPPTGAPCCSSAWTGSVWPGRVSVHYSE